MPVFDKCLAPKWEYINIRNQHNNYFYWKRSGKYRGVKYPCLGRNTNPEGIKHARALFQHVYLQQQAGHVYLFVPPLNFLKSQLENVEAKKGIPTSQACGSKEWSTAGNDRPRVAQTPILLFGRATDDGESENSHSRTARALRETKAFHSPAAKGDFYLLEGF